MKKAPLFLEAGLFRRSESVVFYSSSLLSLRNMLRNITTVPTMAVTMPIAITVPAIMDTIPLVFLSALQTVHFPSSP